MCPFNAYCVTEFRKCSLRSHILAIFHITANSTFSRCNTCMRQNRLPNLSRYLAFLTAISFSFFIDNIIQRNKKYCECAYQCYAMAATTNIMVESRRGEKGSRPPPGNSQVTICFLRNTGTDPPRGWSVRPSVKYIDYSYKSFQDTLLPLTTWIHTHNVTSVRGFLKLLSGFSNMGPQGCKS